MFDLNGVTQVWVCFGAWLAEGIASLLWLFRKSVHETLEAIRTLEQVAGMSWTNQVERISWTNKRPRTSWTNLRNQSNAYKKLNESREPIKCLQQVERISWTNQQVEIILWTINSLARWTQWRADRSTWMNLVNQSSSYLFTSLCSKLCSSGDEKSHPLQAPIFREYGWKSKG